MRDVNPPKYILTYFNARGRAELSRLIFAAANVEYTDNRIDDWPAGREESPLGQLPYLTVDGVKIPQSISIARYLARYLSNLNHLFYILYYFYNFEF